MSMPTMRGLGAADLSDARRYALHPSTDLEQQANPRQRLADSDDPRISGLLLGHSPAIRRVRWLIAKLARTQLPVLISGPTGTGKELVAQALHMASERTGQLVPCNVCAVADGLFESTLFGHVRGSFTGAVSDVAGMLLEANGGTVFLDELSGLGVAAQAKLLRAVETRAFRPVGARADRRSDFRLVAATNEDLPTLVAAGRFRSDLLYRLGAAIIELPSLESRRSDIPLLARHFAGSSGISAAALTVLTERQWPGNVRELRGVVECAVALADGGEVPLAVVSEVLHLRATSTRDDTVRSRGARDLESEDVLYAVLRSHNGDVEAAAAELGVHRATMYRRLRRASGHARHVES